MGFHLRPTYTILESPTVLNHIFSHKGNYHSFWGLRCEHVFVEPPFCPLIGAHLVNTSCRYSGSFVLCLLLGLYQRGHKISLF